MRKILNYCHNKYKNPGGIYVCENGCAVRERCLDESINDVARVDYLRSYITEMHKAIEDGVDVRGYFAWCVVDNYEWGFGYTKRFGMVHVDFDTLKRTPKNSAYWYGKLCNSGCIPE